MDIRLHPREGYLLVEAGGGYDANRGRLAIADIRRECARLGLKKVLVDARGLDATVSVADRFDLARALAEGCTAAVRFAILVKPELMVVKTLENTAMNRGVPVRTTASLEEAYGFLELAPPA